ncbi:mercury resistance system transport protein MerF [Candidatus Spongiihabitans sp.]|uniref:mercury resistance system transport protein MerF n=1 Tax=Candidatus Spongiihabitans sp. TaxID=3101308 RepID=UPI003C7C0B3F
MKLKQSVSLKTGIIGSIILALCCFTPILVVLLGGLGLFAVVGYLDLALFPALAFFIGLTMFALWQQSRR